MRRRSTPAIACAVAIVLAAAPGAAAQSQIAPPGNAGVDEYLETVPSGGGNAPLARGGGARGGAVDPAKRRRLERLGEDGRAAADLAASGAPEPARGRRGGRSSVEGAAPSTGAVGALTDAVAPGSGGMGAALPAILAATLLAAIAVAVTRRRRTAS